MPPFRVRRTSPPRGGRGRRRAAPGRGAGGQSLAGLAGRAVGWSFLSNAVGRLGTVGIGIVLARLLGPHSFGTYAVAWVALLALLSFNDAAVSLAIVRWQSDPREIAPTVTTISVASSVAVYAACFAAAPAYCAAMGAPAAAPVIRVLALNVVLDGLVATPAALLQRHFRQDKKMVADQVNNWLGAVVSIGLAWAGFGAMSLAIGRVAGAASAGALFLVFSPEPLRFGFDPAQARALVRYGTPLAGSALVAFAVTNVDQLVVGRVLGPTTLGFFVLAANLATWPLTIFSRPVRSVAPAAFARLQHDPPAMRTAFESAAALLSSVALPACLVISGSAGPLIGFAYGPRWLPAAQALTWLALLAAFRIFFELVYDYFVVLARTRAVFTVQLVWLAVLIPALIAGAAITRSVFGVGAAEVAVAVCLVLPWYLAELRRAGIRTRAVAARVGSPLAAAVGLGLAAYGVGRAAPGGDLAALGICAVATLAVIAALAIRMRPVVAQLRAAAPAPAPDRPPGTSTGAGASARTGVGARTGASTRTGAGARTGASAATDRAPGAARDEALGIAARATVPGTAARATVPAAAARATGPGPAARPAGPGTAAPGPGRGADRPSTREEPLLTRPGYLDSTGPIPVCRDMTGLVAPAQDDAGLPLIYRQTVAFLRWDPAGGQ